MSHLKNAHEGYKEIKALRSRQMKLHLTEVSRKGMSGQLWIMSHSIFAKTS